MGHFSLYHYYHVTTVSHNTALYLLPHHFSLIYVNGGHENDLNPEKNCRKHPVLLPLNLLLDVTRFIMLLVYREIVAVPGSLWSNSHGENNASCYRYLVLFLLIAIAANHCPPVQPEDEASLAQVEWTTR